MSIRSSISNSAGKLWSSKRFRIVTITTAILTVIAVIILWQLGLTPTVLASVWKDTIAFLKENPWALFLAIVILPGLPVPVSALFIAVGAVWTGNIWVASALAIVAITLNMTWTYFLAAYPARNIIEKVLASTRFNIPDLPKKDHLRLILVLRITPGIPFFLHNYILGFLRAPFSLYLPISVAITGCYTVGFVVTGGAIFDKNFTLAAIGIGLLILAYLITKAIRAYLRRKANNDRANHDTIDVFSFDDKNTNNPKPLSNSPTEKMQLPINPPTPTQSFIEPQDPPDDPATRSPTESEPLPSPPKPNTQSINPIPLNRPRTKKPDKP